MTQGYRRLLISVVCLALLAALCVLPARAASNESPNYTTGVVSSQDLVIRLAQLRAKYAGTYWTTDGQPANSSGSTSRYYYGIQCKGFASYIFNDLFCQGWIGSTSGEKYFLSSPKGATEIGRVWNVTAASAASLLSQARVGDLIQTKRRSSGNPHTMIIGGVDGDGIVIFDCNADGHCKVQWYHQDWGTFEKKNIGVSLYRSNAYPPDSGPAPNPAPAPGNGYTTHELIFNYDYYRAANYYDLGGMSNEQLLAHWLSNGIDEGRCASPVFEAEVYIGLYPDLKQAFGSNYRAAMEHFVTSGVNEGRQASAKFNLDNYKANYVDLQNAFGDDNYQYYKHYVEFGLSENRMANERLKVFFDANGGSVSTASKEITVGLTYGTLPTPTRSGYRFEGWYTSDEGGSKVTSGTQVPNTTYTHRTLYAHWSVNEVTVTFEVGIAGMVSPTSKTVTPGQPYGTLPVAEYLFVGTKFRGWYYGDDLVTASTIVPNIGDHTLEARWKGETYTITFDVEDGCLPASQLTKEVTLGEKYGTLPVPSNKEGYDFAGWWTRVGVLDLDITEDTKVQNAFDHKIYARWTPKTYTVTLNPMGGTLSAKTIRVEYEKYYGGEGSHPLLPGLLPVPSRTGYTFAGWQTEEGEEVLASTIVRKAYDHTLYAGWAPEEYRVTFDPNGGTTAVTEKTVYYDGNYGILPTPYRTGYTLLGWYLNGGRITADTPVTQLEAHTLTAQWVANVYTLTFDPTGGSVSTASKKVCFDDSFGTLPTPVRSYYDFNGWYLQPDNVKVTASTKMTAAKDLTLYAGWTPKSYTVTLDANGGSVTPSTLSVTYTKPYGTLPMPNRTGYSFSGWTMQKNGGERVLSTTINNTPVDHRLYAQWTATQYTVSFNANGGVGTMKSTVKVHDVDLTLPQCEFTRPGYHFAGWATASEATAAQYAAGGIYSLNLPVTFYAVWKKDGYTVSFDPNGGTLEAGSIFVTHDDEYGPMPTPQRSGYKFAGWYYGNPDSPDAVRVYAYTQIMINADHTLTAAWERKTCVVAYNANGGTFGIEGHLKYWGEPLVLPTEIPVRDRYEFLGWSLEQDAAEPDYLPGDPFMMDVDVAVWLYAVWQEMEIPTITVKSEARFFSGEAHEVEELVDFGVSGLTKNDLTITSSDIGVVRYLRNKLMAYNEGSAVLSISLKGYPEIVHTVNITVVDMSLHMNYLPDNLQVVSTEAFADAAFIAVVVPEGCREIKSRAFAGCKKMLYIYLPTTLTDIAFNAFDGCSEDLILYGNSALIEQYAVRNGFGYRQVPGPGGW